jgi:CHAT domain-containing protein
VEIDLMAPSDGTLTVGIDERGISSVSTLNDVPGSTSSSPIDRSGSVTLAANVHAGEHSHVRIHVEDSPDIRGEVCVSAELIGASDRRRAHAAFASASAGRATHARDYKSAFDNYLEAARILDALHEPAAAAAARQAMAELVYRRFDRKRDAYALASEALDEYGTSADPLRIGALAGLEAKALMDMPGVEVTAVAPQIRTWLGTARHFYGMTPYGAREQPRLDILSGFLEYLLDARDGARGFWSRAASKCRELHDWDCYSGASQNLAQLAEEDKNYSLAVAIYADALHQLPQQLDLKLHGDIWNNLGRVQGLMGLFSASERSHAAAMQAYAQLGDCQGVRRSLARAGNLLAHVGNLADAQSDLGRAVSMSCGSLLAAASTPAFAASDDVATTQEKVRRDARDPAEAAPGHPCSSSLDPASMTLENKLIIFNSVLSLGNVAMLTGDNTEVWRCLAAARAYAEDSRSQIRLANALGTAYLERNDPGDARSSFNRALHIADEAGLPATYEHRSSAQLGLVKSELLAGKAGDSLPSAYRVFESSAARGDIGSTIASLELIAAGYRGTGQPEQAVHVLQVAADLIEAVPIGELDGEQRATYLASQHIAFAELTDLLASQPAADDSTAWQAFEASERGRARSLRYALNQETQNETTAADTASALKYRQFLGEVASVGGERPAQDPVRPQMIDAIDRLAIAQDGAPEPFDRVLLGRTLNQLNATLVEYASGPKGMLAFVIGADHAHVVHLGSNAEIEQATSELRDRLRDTEAPAAEVRAAAKALAKLVLWPITPYLPSGRIVFVPDDGLHTVPFAVLPWSAASDQQLLLQHAETAVIPSALFLTHVHAAASLHTERPRVALIGDPVFRVADWRRECIDVETASQTRRTGPLSRTLSAWTESLPRLPGTRAEVTAIARLTRESRPAGHIETIVGCAAVPDALRKIAATDLDLLHIATHARIDSQRPRLSALALTPESPSDMPASTFGLLDILQLKLNSKLVVLSACETSRGRLLPGEGVLGPAQAFLQAGSAAVLASYWRVDDEITSGFMQKFYRYLLVDRLSASAALRRAQLESAAAGSSYEWAAFSLYGWPDSSI